MAATTRCGSFRSAPSCVSCSLRLSRSPSPGRLSLSRGSARRASIFGPSLSGSSRGPVMRSGHGCFRICGRRVRRIGWRSIRLTWWRNGWDTRRRLRPSTTCSLGSTTLRTWSVVEEPSQFVPHQANRVCQREPPRLEPRPPNLCVQIAAHQTCKLQLSRRRRGAAGSGTKRSNPRSPLGLPRVLPKLRQFPKLTKWRG